MEEIHLLTTVNKGISYHKICIWYYLFTEKVQREVSGCLFYETEFVLLQNFSSPHKRFIHSFIHSFERESRMEWRRGLGKSRLCWGLSPTWGLTTGDRDHDLSQNQDSDARPTGPLRCPRIHFSVAIPSGYFRIIVGFGIIIFLLFFPNCLIWSDCFLKKN